VAKANVTINNLLPERIDTASPAVQMAERIIDGTGITVEEAYARGSARRSRPALRPPEEFGDACALPVQRAGRVHQRPEPAARRGQPTRGLI
jgi:hypothetical protein